ncbi:MAG: sulfatase [Armatimonadetes bacterium]|nr:sulfatase [Armatimonadota bacterium]
MNRRDFVASTAAAAAAFAAGAAPAPAPQPNILFCLADDWMWPHASCLGDAVVKTPTFDRVAREGVLFRHAHTAAPSCTASRAAILTGQYPWRLGPGVNLTSCLPAEHEVYPDLLEAAGYHVGYTRKGWAPGNETAAGRRRNPAGPRYRDFGAFLDKRGADQPFCFWFGSVEPHRGYELDSGDKGGLDPAKVKVPPYLPDCDTVRRDICDYYFEVQRFDSDVALLLDQVERAGLADNTIVVMTGDNGWPFPRGKATLYEAGTHAPLAIRWPGHIKPGRTVDDHASLADLCPTFLEAAGLKPATKMTARSLMPVLSAAGDGQIDPTRDHVVTCMERHVRCRDIGTGDGAGYPMRAIRTARYGLIANFHPERWGSGDPLGFEVPGAQPATYQQLASTTRTAYADIDAGPTKAWMVTHRDEPKLRPLFDAAFGKRPARELYDLLADPYEQHNLAGDPAHAAALADLEARLMAELKATADPRVTPGAPEPDQLPPTG